MSSLLERMRKARQRQVELSGHKLTIRRPTDLEFAEITTASGGLRLRDAIKFVVDWDLKEIDLVPGGAPDPVPFDPDDFAEWIEDQPKLWGDLMDKVTELIKDRQKRNEESAKN